MSSIFPPVTVSDILAFQFSSWYPRFKHLSIKSTVIRPLGKDFKRYLLSDGIQIPEGSGNVESAENDKADGAVAEDRIQGRLEDYSDGDAEEPEEHFAFPELDAPIRQAISDYGAVFPKLNFSSPKDAAWILSSSSPLKCMSPMDVYMLLKSSDFVIHDLFPERVFEGCEIPTVPSIALKPAIPSAVDEAVIESMAQNQGQEEQQQRLPPYDLELVLRKWYHVDPVREFRCFVLNGQLIAISQRDENYYDFMKEEQTRDKIKNTIVSLWDREIKDKWIFTKDYVFDLILTRDLESAHIVDFNPYAPRTDSLLFTYEELAELRDERHRQRSSERVSLNIPILRTVDSHSHPAAARNAPANVHNMVPFEMYTMSSGLTIDEFVEKWKTGIQESLEEDSE